ncbi:isoprenyl transferase [Desulfoluna butyratoxydans]|uniref:Isoprenyl transferase n=1 Tax=Desulfoluna butyratoxydans TaxID=231438 RepID=A0A4U8YIA7_9BACT|nr:isoprenyl transferase [Desulfoluna butyratoxydans]VFQ42659.1 putative undecaprenyl diphosphate synthase [Desulfoluna butyratoxydans]
MERELPDGLSADQLPEHVAFIMDGNGRWAKKRVMNRVKGHEKGAGAVRTVVESCTKFGIPYLTLYAFSTENWQRPKKEVDALMGLLTRFLRNEKAQLVKNGVRLTAIGELHRLPEEVRRELDLAMEATRHNERLTLCLALSYGSRSELVAAVQGIADEVSQGRLRAADVDEEMVSQHLFTRGIPDPDLVIRTSGEMRLSNFLLWQCAYSEIFFTETLWPDFNESEFASILMDFQARERRYGKVLQS